MALFKDIERKSLRWKHLSPLHSNSRTQGLAAGTNISKLSGNSLAVQWLGLHASTAGCVGSCKPQGAAKKQNKTQLSTDYFCVNFFPGQILPTIFK